MHNMITSSAYNDQYVLEAPLDTPELTPQTIKSACWLHDGVGAVVRTAGVNRSNFTRWINGAPTLSAARVSNVLVALGLPGGVPDATRVHHWHVKHGYGDITGALRAYFPDGAFVRRAPWSKFGKNMLINVVSFRYAEEVFALTDGRTKAVLRAPTGVLLPVDGLFPFLRWMGGDEDGAVLDISLSDETWLKGQLSFAEFDAKFGAVTAVEPDHMPSPKMADVERLMLRHGLTPGDLVALIQSKFGS